MAVLSGSRKAQEQNVNITEKEVQRLIALLEVGDVKTFNETRPKENFQLQRITVPQGTDLSEVDLSGVDLYQSHLRGVKLHRANLTNAKLIAADLRGSDLTSIFADDANFSRADLRSINGSHGRFRRASLGNALIIEAIFEEADFTDAKLNNCRAEKACFVNADLRAADFTSARLAQASFIDAGLESAIFVEARLNNTKFQNANLISADFTKASGVKVDLTGACLHQASMLGANLKNPIFKDAFVKGLKHSFGEMKEEFLGNAFVGRDADVDEFRKRRAQSGESVLIDSMPNTDRVLLAKVKSKIGNYIGMTNVKTEIEDMEYNIRLDALARKLGEPTVDLKQHIMMVGSPGTGKSSVGKDWGQVLKAYGYLESGHLVYAPGRELVTGKVGHSEERTREYIQRALDGVLFVDETHQLASKSENDFGQYVMGTLVAAMTHYADRLVIIFGCYPGRVEDVLNMDVGLDSRLAMWHFDSYDSGQLIDILNIMLRRSNKTCSPQFLGASSVLCSMMAEAKGDRFGNGRYVEDHLLAGTVKKQRRRLGQSDILTLEDPTKQRGMLRSLNVADLPFREHLGIALKSLPISDLTWVNRENTVVGYNELGDYMNLHEGFPVLSKESHDQIAELLRSKGLLNKKSEE